MTEKRERIEHLEALPAGHPERRAAIVEIMRALQAERGWLDDEAVAEAARLAGMSTIEVEELATFYSLIYRRPVGRHRLLVCDSVSCALRGGGRLLELLERESGLAPGETGPDGALTWLPAICLGLCDRAPAALLDDEALGPLDETRLTELLTRLTEER